MIVTIGGVMLAVNVQPRAFMSVKTHSSPRSETSYAVQENILRQIGLLFLAFGLLLPLLVYREYLRTVSNDD